MDQQTKIKLSSQVALISGIFVFLVSILLLLNFWQVSSTDPLESAALQALVDRLAEEPNNTELKQEIRNYDLLARKAFFTGQWQVKTGSWLLLFGGIVFVIAMRIYHSSIFTLNPPSKDEQNEPADRVLAQRWILGLGILLMILALLSGYFTIDHFKKYEPGVVAAAAIPDEQEDIEVVEISDEEQAKTNEDIEVVSIDESEAAPETETPETSRQTVGEQAKEPSKTEGPVKSVYPTAGEIEKNYYAFRGPWGNGVSKAKNTPVSWDIGSGNNIKWKVQTPKNGHNSPVIWNDLLFVTGADKAEREIYCYNRLSGKLLWTHKADNIPGSPATPPRTTDDTGLAAPSVTTDGIRVYAIFGTGDILACDMNGNRVWAKNIGVPDNHYGHSSSLLCWKNKVFIQFDSNKGGRVLALNVLNGGVLWDTKRPSRISWASPILINVSGTYQLILSSEPIVAAYDIEDGSELWKVDCLMGEIGPSPAYGSGLVFAANEYATLAAIKPETNAEIAWEDNEYLPEVASPVVSNGLLFIATTYGVLACFDANSGSKYWEKEYGQGFYSSPVIADNKLYIFDMGGTAHIFELKKEAVLIGEPSIGERVVTTPAFVDGWMYVRGEKNIYAIGK